MGCSQKAKRPKLIMPNKSKRGHEGIEPSTSPTLKENHTTTPMAHEQVAARSGSCVLTATASEVNPIAFNDQQHCLQSSVGRAVGC